MWLRSRALRSSEHGAPRHHLAPVGEEALEHLLQVQQARLAVDQRHHVHAEGVLQLRLLVQVVEDDLGDFAALQFDDDAHARLVGLVAMWEMPSIFFSLTSSATFEQGLVHLVGSSSTMIACDRPFHVLEMRAAA